MGYGAQKTDAQKRREAEEAASLGALNQAKREGWNTKLEDNRINVYYRGDLVTDRSGMPRAVQDEVLRRQQRENISRRQQGKSNGTLRRQVKRAAQPGWSLVPNEDFTAAFNRDLRRGTSGLFTDTGVFAFGTKADGRNRIRFSDLSSSEMDQIYWQVLGRTPTTRERANQQSNFVHEFLYGARQELKSRTDNGAALRLRYVDQWSKAQKTPGLGRTALQMASIAASVVLPGWYAVAANVGSQVGFGAYDESQGREVDWGRIGTDSASAIALTYVARGFDAGNTAGGMTGTPSSVTTARWTRGAVSAASAYARTGELAPAAVAGAGAYLTTDQPMWKALAADAAASLAAGEDENRVLRDTAWRTAARAAPVTPDGTDRGVQITALRAMASGNPEAMVQVAAMSYATRNSGPAAPFSRLSSPPSPAARVVVPRVNPPARPRTPSPSQPNPEPRRPAAPAPMAPTALQQIGTGGQAIIRGDFK